MQPNAILCCQDRALQASLQSVINPEFQLYVCRDEDELSALLRDVKPELILFHVGVDPTRIDQAVSVILVHEDIPVFVLDGQVTNEIGKVMVKAGARGYCSDHIEPTLIVNGMHSILQGQLWAPRNVMRSIMDELMGRQSVTQSIEQNSEMATLTPREKQVSALVAKGYTNKDVADALGMTVRTVKAHLTASFEKTGTRSRLELSLKLRGDDVFDDAG